MSANLFPTPSKWRFHFKSRGLDEETISTYLTYLRPLYKKGVPVIFTREHLAKLLGRTESFVAAASLRPRYFYRSFEIPKRSGKKRLISAPFASLLSCQRWINNQILSKLPIHEAASGYVHGKSIIDHAQPHLGDKEVLTLDLKDFFPSISLARVIALFRDVGYTHSISLTLAKLCCLDNCLPQGAPTSPALSNIICCRLDDRISVLCKKLNVSYSRYADDLCFSANTLPRSFPRMIGNLVKSEGFLINNQKTRKYERNNTLKRVTGLNVAFDDLRLPKKFKRQISLDLHHIEAHGLLSHLAKRKIHDPSYLSRLLGKVVYWLHIEPENEKAESYKRILLGHISLQS